MPKNGKSWQRRSLPKRIDETARILRRRYRDFAHYNRTNPFEELLFILCSVQTQESNYRRTFAALRRAFPSFDALASASREEIAKPLKQGGLSPTKARRIKIICKRIEAAFGRVTLAPLRQMDDEQCEGFLASLPGVGTKVARCVMMYSLGRRVFPVDTHCWRVCRRLGWARATRRDGECGARDMDRLQAKIPARVRFSLHVSLISLGRQVCTATGPKCPVCPIRRLCRHHGAAAAVSAKV